MRRHRGTCSELMLSSSVSRLSHTTLPRVRVCSSGRTNFQNICVHGATTGREKRRATMRTRTPTHLEQRVCVDDDHVAESLRVLGLHDVHAPLRCSQAHAALGKSCEPSPLHVLRGGHTCCRTCTTTPTHQSGSPGGTGRSRGSQAPTSAAPRRRAAAAALAP